MYLRMQHNYAAYVGSTMPERQRRHFPAMFEASNLCPMFSHLLKQKEAHQDLQQGLVRVSIALQQQSATSLQDTRPPDLSQWDTDSSLTPPYFLSATTEGFRPTGLNSAGAERGRGEALAQAQLSASSQCGLTGVRFTRAWTGAQFQICAQRNVGHATTNTSMCACARMFLSICCLRNPCFSSVVTNTVGWFMSVDEELFLRPDYLCAYVCGCVFFHKYKV